MAGNKIRVVIAYASAGAGHVKAALAIESAFREMNRSDIEVRTINTLDYSTDFMKKSYPAFYLFLVNRIPTIWGLGYYLFDTRLVYRALVGPVRRISNFLTCKRLVGFLNEYKPDIILNTHFLGSDVMREMRKRGMLKDTKLITVVTDYFMHSFWVDRQADYFCVAQNESKAHLMKRGIPAEKIRVFGIPVDRVFSQSKGKRELCGKLGVREDLLTVLITGGGYGVGPVKELVAGISGLKKEMQILVVCGKNPELYKEISEMAGSLGVPVKVYEFVNNMDELMEVSDIMAAKSGGMTSSEAMAKGLPIIITSSIPGQEARNCRYLVKSGAAVYAGSLEKVKQSMADIVSSKEKIEEMKAKINTIKRPNSSLDIAKFALSLIIRSSE